MSNPKTFPIPERMKHLPRDARGYPVPVLVLRDTDGKPHFAINDNDVWMHVVKNDLCAICGKPHDELRWFVGGPGSAFSPQGAYIDPPLHKECAEYALQVCPYLALPKYMKSVGDRTLDKDKLPGGAILVDNTMIPSRPEVFVGLAARGTKIVVSPPSQLLLVPDEVVDVMMWKHGVKVPDEELEDQMHRAFVKLAMDIEETNEIAMKHGEDDVTPAI